MGSMLSIPYNEQYFKSNKIFIPQPGILSDEYNISLPYQNIALGEKTIQLPEITIEGHASEKKVYHDQYEERYKNSHIVSIDPEILRTSLDLKSAMIRANLGMGGLLIVLDGQPLYNQSFDYIETIPTSEITSITVLKGKGGFTMYGEKAKNGVIFITRDLNSSLMKVRTKWVSQNAKDKMLVPIDLYRKTIEYYHPAKFDLDTDPTLQSRATILWESEVYFDGKEPVKIKYNNLNHNGPVVITINGASVNNLVGTGSASYMVE